MKIHLLRIKNNILDILSLILVHGQQIIKTSIVPAHLGSLGTKLIKATEDHMRENVVDSTTLHMYFMDSSDLLL